MPDRTTLILIGVIVLLLNVVFVQRLTRNRPVMPHSESNYPYFWPDARGWIGVAVFSMSVMLLRMMKDPALREDEFFQTIATLVIGTGFVGGVVAWAYAATKQGGEMAERNQAILERQPVAPITLSLPAPGNGEAPKVQIEQPEGAAPLRTTEVEEDTRDLADPLLEPKDDADCVALIERARATGDAGIIANVGRVVANWRRANLAP